MKQAEEEREGYVREDEEPMFAPLVPEREREGEKVPAR